MADPPLSAAALAEAIAESDVRAEEIEPFARRLCGRYFDEVVLRQALELTEAKTLFEVSR